MVDVRMKDKEKPNFEKLRAYLDQQMPRHTENNQNKPYTCSQACCKINTGNNRCCFTQSRSDLDKYGLGVPLYFKFLKTTILYLILFLLLNVFLMNIYSTSYRATEGGKFEDQEDVNLQVRTAMTSLSIGGLTIPSNLFFQLKAKEPGQFSVKCSSGLITSDPKFTYYGLIENEVQAIFTFNMYDSSCNNNTRFLEDINSNCTEKANCTLNYDPNWFNQDCLSKRADSDKLYLKIYCKDTTVAIAGFNYKKSTISLVVVFINLIVILCFALYLCISKVTQEKSMRLYYEHNSSPASYTIKLKGIPTMNQGLLTQKLYDHFEELTKIRKWPRNPVIDIKFAQENKKFITGTLIARGNDRMTHLYSKIKKNMSYLELSEEVNLQELRKQVASLTKEQ